MKKRLTVDQLIRRERMDGLAAVIVLVLLTIAIGQVIDWLSPPED